MAKERTLIEPVKHVDTKHPEFKNMEKYMYPSLKSMAEAKVEGIQKATYFKVDPFKVEFEEGFNLREEGPDLDAHLETMFQAMKEGANFPPIDVSIIDGRIIARDGHCRTRCARRMISEGFSYLLEARQFRGNEAESVYHMVGSANGKPLTPLQAGRGFVRLIRYGATVPEICKRLGLSRPTVDNGIALAEAPVAVQKIISAGEVSAQVALESVKKHGTKAAEILQVAVEKVKAQGGTKVTKKHISASPVAELSLLKEIVAVKDDALKLALKLSMSIEDRQQIQAALDISMADSKNH